MKYLGVFSLAAMVAAGGWYAFSPDGKQAADEASEGAAAASATSIRQPASVPPAAKVSGKPSALRVLKECYESGTCDFPQTDARSYSVALGRQTAAELESLLLGYDGKNSAEMEEIAREFILIDDGFVQEAAIKIFSAVPPSKENAAAMVAALRDAHDPVIIEQAMKEFERYLGTPEEAAVKEFLADFIAHGGQFSAEKASSLILTFLNTRTEANFRAALAEMVPESTAAKNLRLALDEYDRINAGG